jgi:FixJ family two-component response regulator
MADEILILDDDPDLLEALSELIALAFGRDCRVARNVDELIALAAAAPRAALAILDINLGPSQPSGVDAYLWLRDHGFPGRIVFLTGHALSHPLVLHAQRLGDACVLQKPIGVEAIGSLLDGAAT